MHCFSLLPTLPIAHALAHLHASLGDLPPIEYEQQHALRKATMLAGATARDQTKPGACQSWSGSDG